MIPTDEGAFSGKDRAYNREMILERYLKESNYEYDESMVRADQEIEGNDDELRLEPHDEVGLELDEDADEIETDTGKVPDIVSYRNFIGGTPAYDWLKGILKREATLSRGDPDLMEDIGREVLRTLLSLNKVSRRTSSQYCSATFELHWEPLVFMKEQKYTGIPEVLGKVITLTGTADDAQAIPAMKYLSQAWPATGKYMMHIIIDAIHNGYATTKLPDGTELNARFDKSKFRVDIVGTDDSIAEAGQQLAWLGSTLRSSPFQKGIATCAPRIRSVPFMKVALPPNSMLVGEAFFVIDFKIEEPSANNQALPGRCWHGMFRNPVMVTGYPILAKHERKLGLEIPLNIMAALAGSERAYEFDDKVFIKGISTMLIATRAIGDLLIWHYFYNENGEEISYFDHNLTSVDNIHLKQLSNPRVRHVVGWCSECIYHAGADTAEYEINRSGLPRPHPGCLLEKANLSAGYSTIRAGATFALGVRDTPIYFTPENYIRKLQLITEKYVVFWDEEDKRGWLVNGISALLHLVRATLKQHANGAFSDQLLSDFSELAISAKSGPESAIRVLTDPKNLTLKVYPGRYERSQEVEDKQKQDNTIERTTTSKSKSSSYLFQDLVEDRYNILDQIMQKHRHLAGPNGINVKLRLRQHLEGWDFIDLTRDYSLNPRLATLKSYGCGWVDFVRSIEATPLFGKGFGNMIQPTGVGVGHVCQNWKTLPKEKYYLAMAVFDMKKIIEQFGSCNPLQPVLGLRWYSPRNSFGLCRGCRPNDNRERRIQQPTLNVFKKHIQHDDPVQVFSSQHWGPIERGREPKIEELKDTGAIVFGNSQQWSLIWRNEGTHDVREEEPLRDLPTTESESSPVSSVEPSGRGSAHSGSDGNPVSVENYSLLSNFEEEINKLYPRRFDS
ncbi:hypothetical protein K449DRAFT_437747 [Hypoxylon sp. EC38]|nr:hypothetical protein K449DRAFT_437747 [Hypoxylon sp. EC38]